MKVELTNTGVLIDGVLKPWDEVCKILEAGLASEKAKQQPAKDEDETDWSGWMLRVVSTGLSRLSCLLSGPTERGGVVFDFTIPLDQILMPDGTPVMTADELAEKGCPINYISAFGWYIDEGDPDDESSPYYPTELAARKAATAHCRKEGK